MSHKGKIIGSTKTTWSTTNYGNLLSRSWLTLWYWNYACIIYCHLLKSTYINRCVYDSSLTSVLTWMLTYISTSCRHRIISSYKPYSISITLLLYKCYITWNVNAGRHDLTHDTGWLLLHEQKPLCICDSKSSIQPSTDLSASFAAS